MLHNYQNDTHEANSVRRTMLHEMHTRTATRWIFVGSTAPAPEAVKRVAGVTTMSGDKLAYWCEGFLTGKARSEFCSYDLCGSTVALGAVAAATVCFQNFSQAI